MWNSSGERKLATNISVKMGFSLAYANCSQRPVIYEDATDRVWNCVDYDYSVQSACILEVLVTGGGFQFLFFVLHYMSKIKTVRSVSSKLKPWTVFFLQSAVYPYGTWPNLTHGTELLAGFSPFFAVCWYSEIICVLSNQRLHICWLESAWMTFKYTCNEYFLSVCLVCSDITYGWPGVKHQVTYCMFTFTTSSTEELWSVTKHLWDITKVWWKILLSGLMAREMMAQEGKNMAMVQEWKTWQVYCFGKRNVWWWSLKECREGSYWNYLLCICNL